MLLVDTGIHDKRWSREQAIAYMIETVGLAPGAAESECERYCVWPGQAFMDRTIVKGQTLLVSGPVRFYHGRQMAPREYVILADEEDFPGLNEEWLKWFPSDPPARQGAKLPVRIPGLKVSIAAIAEA